MRASRKDFSKGSLKYDRFRRSSKKLETRPIFYIASEGKNTEPDYFGNIIAQMYPNIHIVQLEESRQKGAVYGHDPLKLKKRVENCLKEITDQEKGVLHREAWVVMDRDEKSWTEEQLNAVAQGVEKENNKNNKIYHGMALSNPCFEFWLLLHFDEGTGAVDNDKCISLLKKHVPAYEKDRSKRRKSLDHPDIIKLFTGHSIENAIMRAKTKDIPPCKSWPKQSGCTTVYLLVERILDAARNIPD